MAFRPPSTDHLHRAIVSLLPSGEGDFSESFIRCQMIYHSSGASYTVWARSSIREGVSNALSGALGRPFSVADDYWTLKLGEAESLLTANST
jgi:hypothetical protein